MTIPAKPTVLLSGATGFLGSYLLRALLRHGCTVVAAKRSTSSTWRIADLLDRIEAVDVDQVSLNEVFDRRQIDIVIHSATCYGRKGESVQRIVESNLVYPLTLLELASRHSTAFINTDTVLPEGLNYYVLSKKQFLEYGRRFAEGPGPHFLNLRLEHIYGPNDDPGGFIPFLIQAFLRNEPYVDLTKGEQRRDFVFVEDAVDAYLLLLSNLWRLKHPYAEYTIGSGEARELAAVVRRIHAACGGATELRFGALPYRAGEVMHSQADIGPLQVLGWAPSVGLDAGLIRTIEIERRRTN
ncbi:NAD-dependent epimerase/dehydratase family protein [Paludibaculum fermentans]|uniref:NAD-dependent epimerase/dehydratase family protein n=1 Tax=Paludibaculum fermentans TaxID=1473598 RepID=UPI003EBA8711